MYAYDIDGIIYSWNSSALHVDYTFDNNGDILTMKLKFDDDTAVLTLKINDKKEFVVSNKVTRDKKLNYRLAIAMSNNDCSYQLID